MNISLVDIINGLLYGDYTNILLVNENTKVTQTAISCSTNFLLSIKIEQIEGIKFKDGFVWIYYNT